MILCRRDDIAAVLTYHCRVRCTHRSGYVILGIAVCAAGLTQMGMVQIAASRPLGGVRIMVLVFFYVRVAANSAFSLCTAGSNATLVVFLLQEVTAGGTDLIVIRSGGAPAGGSMGVSRFLFRLGYIGEGIGQLHHFLRVLLVCLIDVRRPVAVDAKTSYITPIREFSVVIGSILGFIFLNEKITLNKIIGIVTILLGVVMIKIG